MARRGVVTSRRLLFVVNDAAFFVSHRLPLAVAAREAGYDVHVATADAPAADPIRAAGLPLHNIPFTRQGTHIATELRAPLALARLHRQLQPHLVHHVTSKAILYGWLALRMSRHRPAVVNAVTGLGYVFTESRRHVSAGRRMMLVWYRLALRARRSIALFQNADDLEVLAGREQSRIRTVLIPGAGVDIHRFAFRPEPTGIPLVVFPGRMLRHKGVAEFVDAARMLKVEGVVARFALVGGADAGNPTVIPDSVLHGWTASGEVEWWGEREDMPEVLAQSAIVCLPSYREGTPKSLLEAAAVGRPIVTSDAPGCRVVVRQGDNGLLVPVRDPRALADALGALLSDARLRARMGQAGRRRAEQEFSLEHVIGRTLEVYDQVLGG